MQIFAAFMHSQTLAWTPNINVDQSMWTFGATCWPPHPSPCGSIALQTILFWLEYWWHFKFTQHTHTPTHLHTHTHIHPHTLTRTHTQVYMHAPCSCVCVCVRVWRHVRFLGREKLGGGVLKQSRQTLVSRSGQCKDVCRWLCVCVWHECVCVYVCVGGWVCGCVSAPSPSPPPPPPSTCPISSLSVSKAWFGQSFGRAFFSPPPAQIPSPGGEWWGVLRRLGVLKDPSCKEIHLL